MKQIEKAKWSEVLNPDKTFKEDVMVSLSGRSLNTFIAKQKLSSHIDNSFIDAFHNVIKGLSIVQLSKLIQEKSAEILMIELEIEKRT